MFFKVKVEGESLWPEIVAGKEYLASSLLKPRLGDYVVFNSPLNVRRARPVRGKAPRGACSTASGRAASNGARGVIIIKKVKAVNGEKYHVGSTVSWGSEHVISSEDIVGKILLKLT